MIENEWIYRFSSEDIQLARDSWRKAYKSIKRDELEKFNKVFGPVVELCYIISLPIGYIQGLGLDKYEDVLKHHAEIGNLLITGKTARISLDGRKALDEITKPKFRAEQYRS